MKKPPAQSTQLAGAILQAWRSDDLQYLDRELAAASTLQCDVEGNAGEGERRELLRGIASAMRSVTIVGQVPVAGVYISVLQHLAQPIAPRTVTRPCSL